MNNIENKQIRSLNNANIVLPIMQLIFILGLFAIVCYLQVQFSNGNNQLFDFEKMWIYLGSNIPLSVSLGIFGISSAAICLALFLYIIIYLSIFKRIHKDNRITKKIYICLIVNLIIELATIAFFCFVIFTPKIAIWPGFIITVLEFIAACIMLSIHRTLVNEIVDFIYYPEYSQHQFNIFRNSNLNNVEESINEKDNLLVEEPVEDEVNFVETEEIVEEPDLVEEVQEIEQEPNIVSEVIEPVYVSQNVDEIEEEVELESDIQPEIEEEHTINVEATEENEDNDGDEIIDIIEEPVYGTTEFKTVEETPDTSNQLSFKKDAKLLVEVDEEKQKEIEEETFEVVKLSDLKGSNDEEYEIETPNTIIISLSPKIVEEIVNEGKDILFFKKIPIHKVERVIVYCVKPIGRVVGEFILRSSDRLPKSKAWSELAHRSTISRKDFASYFEDSREAKYLEIEGFVPYKHSRDVNLYGLNKGPAGFSYLRTSKK